jgi:hypothetical protein
LLQIQQPAQNPDMKLKPGTEKEYAKYKAKNNDPYGGCVVQFAEDWADLMEAEMAQGKKIAEIAKPTCSKSNKKHGITSFMYGCAVNGLAHFWEHGEALRLWHNLDTQLGNEGEKANESGGVLNPALLNFGIPQDNA